MSALIAYEELVAVHASGREVQVSAGVGQPAQVRPDEWSCAVRVTGIHEVSREIHGGSSLQALCLALGLIRQLLSQFVEEGGTLRHGASEEPFDIGTCFSGVGR